MNLPPKFLIYQAKSSSVTLYFKCRTDSTQLFLFFSSFFDISSQIRNFQALPLLLPWGFSSAQVSPPGCGLDLCCSQPWCAGGGFETRPLLTSSLKLDPFNLLLSASNFWRKSWLVSNYLMKTFLADRNKRPMHYYFKTSMFRVAYNSKMVSGNCWKQPLHPRAKTCCSDSEDTWANSFTVGLPFLPPKPRGVFSLQIFSEGWVFTVFLQRRRLLPGFFCSSKSEIVQHVNTWL